MNNHKEHKNYYLNLSEEEKEEYRRKGRERYYKKRGNVRTYQAGYRKALLEKDPDYYKKYLEQNKERNNFNRKERQIRLKQKLLEYKKDKFCSVCGYKEHPEILQFHHKNKEEKSFGIGNGANKPWNIFLEEINKCILLCPNCHLLLHYKEGNYYAPRTD